MTPDEKMEILILNQLNCIEDGKMYLNKYPINGIDNILKLAIPAVKLIFEDFVKMDNFNVVVVPGWVDERGKTICVTTRKTFTHINGPLTFDESVLQMIVPQFKAEFGNWINNYKTIHWYIPICSICKVYDPSTSVERYGFMTRFKGLN